jgi:hypothetical protein
VIPETLTPIRSLNVSFRHLDVVSGALDLGFEAVGVQSGVVDLDSEALDVNSGGIDLSSIDVDDSKRTSTSFWKPRPLF